MASEWKECLLGDLVELKRGYDLPKKNRVEGSVPVISSSGTSDYHAESKVSGPGVVTGRYGTLGEVFYTEDDYWPLNTTLYVKDFKGNDPKFIYYFLKTIPYHLYSDKAAVPGVNRNHLHLASVKAPTCRNEQKRLGQLLSEFDDKIQLNRQTNQTFENMAQALFKSWFVDFDPVIDNALAASNTIPEPLQKRAEQRRALRASFETQGSLSQDQPAPLPEAIRQLFPASFVFDAGMGWVPEGWGVQPVGKVIENVGGGTPRTKEDTFWVGGTHAFCTPKDMSLLTSKALLGTERHLTDVGVAKISSGQLPEGTVLMSSRAPIGYLAINDIPVSVNQGIIAMKPNDAFSSEYLLSWAEANMEEVESRANGSTFLEISKKNFREIPFLMPDEAVLNQYDKIAKPYFQRIVSIQKEVNQLAKLRDTLLPKLISGELRIPEAQQQTEAAVA